MLKSSAFGVRSTICTRFLRSDTFFCWMLPPSVQTEMSCVRIICVRTPAKCSKSSILFAISRLIVLSRTPDRVLPAMPGVYDHGYAVFARKHGRCMPQLRRRIHTYEERC